MSLDIYCDNCHKLMKRLPMDMEDFEYHHALDFSGLHTARPEFVVLASNGSRNRYEYYFCSKECLLEAAQKIYNLEFKE